MERTLWLPWNLKLILSQLSNSAFLFNFKQTRDWASGISPNWAIRNPQGLSDAYCKGRIRVPNPHSKAPIMRRMESLVLVPTAETEGRDENRLGTSSKMTAWVPLKRARRQHRVAMWSARRKQSLHRTLLGLSTPEINHSLFIHFQVHVLVRVWLFSPWIKMKVLWGKVSRISRVDSHAAALWSSPVLPLVSRWDWEMRVYKAWGRRHWLAHCVSSSLTENCPRPVRYWVETGCSNIDTGLEGRSPCHLTNLYPFNAAKGQRCNLLI